MPRFVVQACALALILAALPMPYGYYSLLRLVSCAVFGIAAYTVRRRHSRVVVWVYGFCALLFNPIFKVYLPKSIWVFLDLTAAIILLFSAKLLAGEDITADSHGGVKPL